MPAEQGYQSQVGPTAAPVAPLATAETYGAQVGAAIDGVAQTIHRVKLREYEIERKNTAESEWLDFQRAFAGQRQNMDGIVRQMRSTAAPGGVGHAEGVAKNWDVAKPVLLGGITDDAVRQKAEMQLLEFGGRLQEQESTWQEGKRVGKITGDFEETVNIAANRARRSPDDKAFEGELATAYDTVEGLQNVDADTKVKLARYAEQSIAIGFVNGLIDTNPAMAKAQIAAGAFDYLEPAQLDQLRNGADVEIRRMEAAAEHEAALATAEFNQKISTAAGYISQGVDIPEDELAALHEEAVARGDTDTAVKIEGWQTDNTFAKIWRGATPVQRQNRLAELTRKKQPTIKEQREAAWLRGSGAELDGQQNSDPVAYWTANGTGAQVPPEIDLNDPGSLQLRAAWARRMAQTNGTTGKIFSKNDLVPLQDMLESGDAGRKQLLGVLDALSGSDRALAALQIAPTDYSLRHETQMPRGIRDTVWAGRQVLAGNPKFWNTDTKTQQGRNAAALLSQSGKTIASVLHDAAPAEQQAVTQIAGQWLARTLSRQGRGADSITPADIGTAVNIALGGHVDRDGHTWIGGRGVWSGGHDFVLPETMTQPQFAHAVTRDARAKEGRGAGPVNPDGSPFSLNQAKPIFMGGGRYRWESRGGSPVRTKNGQPFITEVGGR